MLLFNFIPTEMGTPLYLGGRNVCYGYTPVFRRSQCMLLFNFIPTEMGTPLYLGGRNVCYGSSSFPLKWEHPCI